MYVNRQCWINQPSSESPLLCKFFNLNGVTSPFCHSGCCASSSVLGHLLPFSPWHPQRLWRTWYHNSHCRYSLPSQSHPSHHALFLFCGCHSCSSWAPPGCRLEWLHTPLQQRISHTQMLPHGYLTGSEQNDQLITYKSQEKRQWKYSVVFQNSSQPQHRYNSFYWNRCDGVLVLVLVW